MRFSYYNSRVSRKSKAVTPLTAHFPAPLVSSLNYFLFSIYPTSYLNLIPSHLYYLQPYSIPSITLPSFTTINSFLITLPSHYSYTSKFQITLFSHPTSLTSFFYTHNLLTPSLPIPPSFFSFPPFLKIPHQSSNITFSSSNLYTSSPLLLSNLSTNHLTFSYYHTLFLLFSLLYSQTLTPPLLQSLFFPSYSTSYHHSLPFNLKSLIFFYITFFI
jgi:hypothetical protein